MRTLAALVGVVVLSSAVGCAGGSDDPTDASGADIKQADCAPTILVHFDKPTMDSDAQIEREADETGADFKKLATPLATAKALKPITATAQFTNAAAGACNYKLTARDGSAVDGDMHTIGTSGRFFMRYEIGGVLYNMTVKSISKTDIQLQDGSATVMLSDGGIEFHGEPDPSVIAGKVNNVTASIPH